QDPRRLQLRRPARPGRARGGGVGRQSRPGRGAGGHPYRAPGHDLHAGERGAAEDRGDPRVRRRGPARGHGRRRVHRAGPRARVVTLDEVSTMADGIALKSACDLTLAHIRAYVDDVVTVTEEETSRALLLLLERAKAVVEPAGAVAVAALLSGKVGGRGPAVA